MNTFAWFRLVVIICTVTIGVNSILYAYWRYRYISNKKSETVKNESGEGQIISEFPKDE